MGSVLLVNLKGMTAAVVLVVMATFKPGASSVDSETIEGAVFIPQPSARDIVNQSITLRRSISHTGLPPGTFGRGGGKSASRRWRLESRSKNGTTESNGTQADRNKSESFAKKYAVVGKFPTGMPICSGLFKGPHSGAIDHLLYLIEPPVSARSVDEFRLQFGVLVDTLKELEIRDEERSRALRECNRLKARLKGETLYRKELIAIREGLCEELRNRHELLYSRLRSLEKVEDALRCATESNERLRESIRKTDAEIDKTRKIDDKYCKRAAELYKGIKKLGHEEDSDVDSSSGVTSRSMSSENSSEPPRMSIISNMLIDGDCDSTDSLSSEHSSSEISLDLLPRRVEVINL